MAHSKFMLFTPHDPDLQQMLHTLKGSVVARWFCVRLEIEGSLVWDSQEGHIVSLGKTLYLLLSTGPTQEDRKLSQHDGIIVDWELKHQHKQNKHTWSMGLNLIFITICAIFNVCLMQSSRVCTGLIQDCLEKSLKIKFALRSAVAQW